MRLIRPALFRYFAGAFPSSSCICSSRHPALLLSSFWGPRPVLAASAAAAAGTVRSEGPLPRAPFRARCCRRTCMCPCARLRGQRWTAPRRRPRARLARGDDRGDRRLGRGRCHRQRHTPQANAADRSDATVQAWAYAYEGTVQAHPTPSVPSVAYAAVAGTLQDIAKETLPTKPKPQPAWF